MISIKTRQEQLENTIYKALKASPKPLTLQELCSQLQEKLKSRIPKQEIKQAIGHLANEEVVVYSRERKTHSSSQLVGLWMGYKRYGC